MRQTIEAIDVVSDGIVVQFEGGVRCYFPAAFLLDHVNMGSNQVFLDHDPTPGAGWDMSGRLDVTGLEALRCDTQPVKPRVC